MKTMTTDEKLDKALIDLYACGLLHGEVQAHVLPTPDQREIAVVLAKTDIRQLIEDEKRELLERLEAMTHDGRGTILWEMDKLSTAINEELNNLQGESHG